VRILERDLPKTRLSDKIIQLFEENNEPRTHKEICLEVAKGTDLATVYGVLQRLVKKGVLLKEKTDAGIIYVMPKDTP